jgi:hypothetical protein
MTKLVVAIGGFRLRHWSLGPAFSFYAVPATLGIGKPQRHARLRFVRPPRTCDSGPPSWEEALAVWCAAHLPPSGDGGAAVGDRSVTSPEAR